MKTKILISIAFCILFSNTISIQKAQAYCSQDLTDSIRIFSSSGLYNLTSGWVSEYSKSNQSVKIKVFKLQDNQTDISQVSDGSVFFISNEYYSNQKDQSTWEMIVGVEALVPVINSKNPFLDDINMKGISSEKMAQLFEDSGNRNWGVLLETKISSPVHFYIVNSDYSKSELLNYLKLDPEMITGIVVENEEELIAAIQKDPLGIGFCQIAKVLDNKTKSIVQGINLLPIDRNNNGKVDNSERIYNDINEFLRGVWIGKYPKELTQNIYSVSAVKPTNKSLVEFLAWVVTDGQHYLNSNGFSDLTSNLRKANVNNLYEKSSIAQSSNSRSVIPIAAIILVIFLTLFFVVDFILQRSKETKLAKHELIEDSSPFFDDNSIIVPDGLYFDKSHTWAFMEKDGVVGIGIDDFLQNITGPITRVKMKEVGVKVKMGEPFLTLIQDGKQLNIKSPLSGTIKAQNKNLISNSSLINKSPYNEGWIYKIEPANWMFDIQFLIFAQGYKEWLKMEFVHLKDFFAIAARSVNTVKAHVILQDGGVIRKGILKDLKPEVWEDFQTHFLDSSK